MQYTIQRLAKITGGVLTERNLPASSVIHLITDSRRVISPVQSLFFAISGSHHDGHEFIDELYNSGCKNFVVSDSGLILPNYEANFILVDDALKALQQVAAYHRKQFAYPVIGVTGSNGKTIIKEWLYQLLRDDFNIVRSPKSYNSQIGVPLSVWQMSEENTLAIFEAGISRNHEMEKLEEIIVPSIGIFSNIGTAHDENFRSLQEKVIEKLKLFTHCPLLIYCKDYLAIHEQLLQVDFLPEGQKYFRWSRKAAADLQVARITKENGITAIQGIYKNDFISIKIPFSDEASIENAIHCWALMLHLNYDHEVIAQRMELLSPVAMRLELKEGINNCSIINDSYNSDIGSLTIALDFLNQQKQHPSRSIILSDILQSGRSEESLYKEVASLLEKKGIKKIIGIGPCISRQEKQFSNMQKQFFRSTDEFVNQFQSGWFNDETVLLKGARAFSFERITSLMQQKAHETVLEINLNALVHNLNFFRSRLKPETKVMAMVKALSYGSGSFEIANTLQFHRVDYLAVAYADEGIELRKAGITAPIMVMSPEVQSFDSMIHYKLEPEIYSFRILTQFNEAIKRNSAGRSTDRISIHVKLDTGMHRLGFEEKDLNELVVRIKNSRNLRIQSVFSHLAGSDEDVHDAFTQKQIAQFSLMCEKILPHFDYPVLRHILNSAGILRFPEAQFEMVRLGIGLHGVTPGTTEQKHLLPVASLKTTISQIKNVAQGETIGYSRSGKATHAMQIATVAVGYADGYNRKLGNGAGSMIVSGKRVPVIGSVCMDMCMLDVTGMHAGEGDEVIVFGSGMPVTELAQKIGTIPYEVLTGVSQRVKRVYFHE